MSPKWMKFYQAYRLKFTIPLLILILLLYRLPVSTFRSNLNYLAYASVLKKENMPQPNRIEELFDLSTFPEEGPGNFRESHLAHIQRVASQIDDDSIQLYGELLQLNDRTAEQCPAQLRELLGMIEGRDDFVVSLDLEEVPEDGLQEMPFQLLGVIFPKAMLSFDVNLPLTTIWEHGSSSTETGQSGGKVTRCGRYWIQMQEARNLIRNSAMEWPHELEAYLPPGFQEIHTFRAADSYHIELLKEGNSWSQVACFTASPLRRRVGISSDLGRIDQGINTKAGYLLTGGDIWSDREGQPAVYLAAYTELSDAGRTLIPINLSDGQAGRWQSFSAIRSIEDEEYSHLQMWIQIFEKDSGKVCVDNLFLFKLDEILSK